MTRFIFAWVAAVALAAMPIGAWMTSACPMVAGQTAVSDADGPMPADCGSKQANHCAQVCAAMAGPAVALPAAVTVSVPAVINRLPVALASAILIAGQPSELDRPPRTIA